MATLAVLEQRKHELRTELVRSVQGNGREHPDTWKIYRKLNEVKRAETSLRRFSCRFREAGYKPCLRS